MNVSLKAEWEAFIQEQVSNGEYDTASEVVRAGLRLLKHEAEDRKAKVAAFKAAIAEGVEQARRGELHESNAVLDDLFVALERKAAAKQREDVFEA